MSQTEFSEQTINSLKLLFSLQDCNSRYLWASEALAKLFGFKSADEIKGKTDYDLPCKAAICADEFIRQDKAVIRRKTELNFLSVNAFTDNQQHIYLVKKTPVYHQEIVTGIATLATELNTDFLRKINLSMQKLTELQSLAPSKPQPNFTLEIIDPVNDIQLSRRERECLFFIIRGQQAKHIARTLGLSARTVEHYCNNLKLKFGCTTRQQLLEIAYEKGYINIIPKSLLYNNLINF